MKPALRAIAAGRTTSASTLQGSASFAGVPSLRGSASLIYAPNTSGMPAGMISRSQIIAEAGTLVPKESLPTITRNTDIILGTGAVLEDTHYEGNFRVKIEGDNVTIRNCWLESDSIDGHGVIIAGSSYTQYDTPTGLTIEHCRVEHRQYVVNHRALLTWISGDGYTLRYNRLHSLNCDIGKLPTGRQATGFANRWARRTIVEHNYCTHERQPGSGFHMDMWQGNGDSYFQVRHNVFEGDWVDGTNSCVIIQGESYPGDIGNYEWAWNWHRGGKNLGEPANPYTQAGDYHIGFIDGYNLGAWFHHNVFEVDASDGTNQGWYQFTGAQYSQVGKVTAADDVYMNENTFWDPTTNKYGQDVVNDDVSNGNQLNLNNINSPGGVKAGPPPQLPPVDARDAYVPPWT